MCHLHFKATKEKRVCKITKILSVHRKEKKKKKSRNLNLEDSIVKKPQVEKGEVERYQ